MRTRSFLRGAICTRGLIPQSCSASRVTLNLIAAFSLVAAATVATNVLAAVQTFIVPLDGRQEIFGPTTPTPGQPNAGDLDGSGTALLSVDPTTNTISWNITVNGITTPIAAAHIHSAPAGTNGPIVIDFNGALSGSTTDPDVAALLSNPSGFYVNVHNRDFPSGAVRGQIVAEPGALALLGLTLLLGWRRLRQAPA